MIKGTLKITNNITSKLDAMQDKLDKLPDEAYKVFLKNTPVRKGNARRNTKLQNNKKKINANYGYAERLNEGYSKQSPDGMVQPTVDFITDKFKKIMTGR